jgi:hypothetical protein
MALTTEPLIQHLSALLVIIWLVRDAPNLVLNRLSTHPVENFFGLLRRITQDVNPFSQMLKVTANMPLMNKGIETFAKEADLDVRRIPSRMNMAGLKFRGAKLRRSTCPG